QAVQPVGAPARLELVERRQLGRPRGDDQLAAALVRHAVPLDQAVHGVSALHPVPGLQRPRLVVQARVDHAAVVTALVGGELGLGLEHHERAAQPLAEGVGGGDADDAAADDGHVVPWRRAHPATSGGGVSCSTNQRSTSSGVMMPTSFPARVTGRWWMRCARSMAITSSAGANSSMEIVGCDMTSRAPVTRGSRRSALTPPVPLTKPPPEPPASTTGPPPMRPATSVAAIAASGVSGATDATRSVIMFPPRPFTPPPPPPPPRPPPT